MKKYRADQSRRLLGYMGLPLQLQSGISIDQRSSSQRDGSHLPRNKPHRHFSATIVMLCSLSVLVLEAAWESR